MTFGPITTRKYEEMTPTQAVEFRESCPASPEWEQYPRGIREDAQPDEDTGTHHHQDGTTTSSPEEDLAATPTPQRPA